MQIHLQEPWWSYVANGRKSFHLQPLKDGSPNVGDAIKFIRSGKAITMDPSQITTTVTSASIHNDCLSALSAYPLESIFPGVDNKELATAIFNEISNPPERARVEVIGISITPTASSI
jgi:hypothetical protein